MKKPCTSRTCRENMSLGVVGWTLLKVFSLRGSSRFPPVRSGITMGRFVDHRVGQGIINYVVGTFITQYRRGNTIMDGDKSRIDILGGRFNFSFLRASRAKVGSRLDLDIPNFYFTGMMVAISGLKLGCRHRAIPSALGMQFGEGVDLLLIMPVTKLGFYLKGNMGHAIPEG
ncbi:hypothetical protein AG1IA_02939 [Rhizoctonia solani AG-1 IA]|uniref:Uncharacterized protein n=1 Tax=Thanatephorus cucumeris (strain AG1-IA) TaxID=983506 RepID=L8X328_THACA|nr:hypothetical protein AG1IA_02939 [Rhizoctonia solani AG-1 IA]